MDEKGLNQPGVFEENYGLLLPLKHEAVTNDHFRVRDRWGLGGGTSVCGNVHGNGRVWPATAGPTNQLLFNGRVGMSP